MEERKTSGVFKTRGNHIFLPNLGDQPVDVILHCSQFQGEVLQDLHQRRAGVRGAELRGLPQERQLQLVVAEPERWGGADSRSCHRPPGLVQSSGRGGDLGLGWLSAGPGWRYRQLEQHLSQIDRLQGGGTTQSSGLSPGQILPGIYSIRSAGPVPGYQNILSQSGGEDGCIHRGRGHGENR